MEFKYPKLMILITTFVLAYAIIGMDYFSGAREIISGAGYAGAFISGVLIAYGFTAAIATAAFLIIGQTHDIYLAAALGGAGAVMGDLMIFSILRHSFHEEIHLLSNENIIAKAREIIPAKALKYLMPIIGGLIIASPLPDEIGVALLAASTRITGWKFAALSFCLNTAGIFAILWAGNAL